MNNWNNFILSDVLQEKGYIRGPFGSALKRNELLSMGIPVYEQQHAIYNIREFRFFIDENKFEKMKRFQVKENDLIISCSGTVGKVSIINKDDPKGIISQALLLLRVNETIINPLYLKYFFVTEVGYNSIVSRSGGSVQVNISKRSVIEKIPLLLPSRLCQDNIVKVLSSLDDKIELNSRIAGVLEKMMREIYDYWFVQFDFPDKNGKPYQSSGGEMVYNPTLKRLIPKGWEVGKLKDFLEVKTGKKDANFSTKNGKYAFFTCGDETLKCDEFEFEGKSILLAGNGNFNVKYYDGKFNAYQRTYVLIPKEEKYFGTIYISVLNRVEALTKNATGSIIKFITKGDVENIPVIFNYNDDSFLHIVNSSLTMQNELKKQTQTLTALRDFLLPLLMNGQASVR